MPCSEKRARKLLESGRARVHRLYPFTIRIKDLEHARCVLQPVRLSIDPGSFNIQKHEGGKSVVVQGISHSRCRVISRGDGYGYSINRQAEPFTERTREAGHAVA